MKASGEVNAERAGDVFTTLVGLLKATSQHFAINIGKQVHTHVVHVYGSMYIHQILTYIIIHTHVSVLQIYYMYFLRGIN